MSRSGFGLIETIIVITILSILVGGGLYLKNLDNQKTIIEQGIDAEKKAKELKNQLDERTQEEKNIYNQITP